jgi:L,D-transpeptidase YcbB
MSKRLKSSLAFRALRPALMLASAMAASLGVPAIAATEPAHAAEQSDAFEAQLRAFYAARQNRPLWFAADGRADPAVPALLELLATAELDGVNPAWLQLETLRTTIAQAPRSPQARDLAEMRLTRTFAAYVQAVRHGKAAAMTYQSEALHPRSVSIWDTLKQVERTPSLQQYVAEMGWMHPLYAPLRRALDSGGVPRELALRNLARIRAIPALTTPRHVLVDTASARLWMYEDGRVVDSMRVVVGKPDQQTPLISGFIRNAIFNPYWNVPTDLVATRIAPNVLSKGVGYLKTAGYQVLADWSEDPAPLDPAKVDWQAVARGEVELRVRQRPGGGNAMGKVKYEFPNQLGIYLHDTPDKNLMLEEARQFSSGCIRLEDAERLGRWLMRGTAPAYAADPEQRVDLPDPVPVYVTYLTAYPSNGTIALGPDPYQRDSGVRTNLALGGGGTITVR